jgi:hypothetical protein
MVSLHLSDKQSKTKKKKKWATAIIYMVIRGGCWGWWWQQQHFQFLMAGSYIVAHQNTVIKCIYAVLALRVWCYDFAEATSA